MIKALLLTAFVFLALFAARSTGSTRHQALRHLGTLTVFSAAVVAVLFPDILTRLAQSVGVGRGTDLVLYFFVVTSVLVWINTNRRLRHSEDRLTQVVRAIAINGAGSGAHVAGDGSPETDQRAR